MDLSTLMQQLESMGTAQNIKIYKRHGAKEPLFGVSFANLGKLRKKIKNNIALARELWQTRNTEARTLACMIADPDEMSASELDSWVVDVNYTTLAGYFGGLVGKGPFALEKIKIWTHSKAEFVVDSGYSCICQSLKNSPDKLSDALCMQALDWIDHGIHLAPNRAKQAMNNALIAIGTYKENCREKALLVAGRLGKLEIDHGETQCKTSDAISYIQKSVAHLEKKKKKTKN